MTRLHVLFLLIALAISAPFAAANSITYDLNQTNLSGYLNAFVGTVNVTDATFNGHSGVWVTFHANSGFSFKLDGGDLLFNSSATLSAGSISGLTIDTLYTSNFSFGGSPTSTVTRAGRSYNYDMANLKNSHHPSIGNLPNGYVAAGTIKFFISGVSSSQLSNFGVHFCAVGGTNCDTNNTGFAHSSVTVPEPGTLSLLGTGIVGLAGLFRRRLLS